jgi:hypothetical protein
VSWIEQGPITTIKRSSSPVKILCKAMRALPVVSDAFSEQENSRIKCEGGNNSFISLIRKSSVRCMLSPKNEN